MLWLMMMPWWDLCQHFCQKIVFGSFGFMAPFQPKNGLLLKVKHTLQPWLLQCDQSHDVAYSGLLVDQAR